MLPSYNKFFAGVTSAFVYNKTAIYIVVNDRLITIYIFLKINKSKPQSLDTETENKDGTE